MVPLALLPLWPPSPRAPFDLNCRILLLILVRLDFMTLVSGRVGPSVYSFTSELFGLSAGPFQNQVTACRCRRRLHLYLLVLVAGIAGPFDNRGLGSMKLNRRVSRLSSHRTGTRPSSGAGDAHPRWRADRGRLRFRSQAVRCLLHADELTLLPKYIGRHISL